jgi:hypothetical protein
MARAMPDTVPDTLIDIPTVLIRSSTRVSIPENLFPGRTIVDVTTETAITHVATTANPPAAATSPLLPTPSAPPAATSPPLRLRRLCRMLTGQSSGGRDKHHHGQPTNAQSDLSSSPTRSANFHTPPASRRRDTSDERSEGGDRSPTRRPRPWDTTSEAGGVSDIDKVDSEPDWIDAIEVSDYDTDLEDARRLCRWLGGGDTPESEGREPGHDLRTRTSPEADVPRRFEQSMFDIPPGQFSDSDVELYSVPDPALGEPHPERGPCDFPYPCPSRPRSRSRSPRGSAHARASPFPDITRAATPEDTGITPTVLQWSVRRLRGIMESFDGVCADIRRERVHDEDVDSQLSSLRGDIVMLSWVMEVLNRGPGYNDDDTP